MFIFSYHRIKFPFRCVETDIEVEHLCFSNKEKFLYELYRSPRLMWFLKCFTSDAITTQAYFNGNMMKSKFSFSYLAMESKKTLNAAQNARVLTGAQSVEECSKIEKLLKKCQRNQDRH